MNIEIYKRQNISRPDGTVAIYNLPGEEAVDIARGMGEGYNTTPFAGTIPNNWMLLQRPPTKEKY